MGVRRVQAEVPEYAGTAAEWKYVSPSMTISSPFHSRKVRLGPSVRVIFKCQKPPQPVLRCIMMAFDKEDRLAGRVSSFLHSVLYPNEMQGELGEKLYMTTIPSFEFF
jgi:hypothetical protein